MSSNRTPTRAEEAVTLSAIETDDCTPWPHFTRSDGYAQISLRDSTITVHRYVLTQATGTNPAGLVAAHSCRNRSCINLRHLRWATPAENSADMIADHTMRAKLTPADVLDIRASTQSAATLAQHYGVARNTIHSIRTHKSWKHIQQKDT
jgi:hypothetical protein